MEARRRGRHDRLLQLLSGQEPGRLGRGGRRGHRRSGTGRARRPTARSWPALALPASGVRIQRADGHPAGGGAAGQARTPGAMERAPARQSPAVTTSCSRAARVQTPMEPEGSGILPSPVRDSQPAAGSDLRGVDRAPGSAAESITRSRSISNRRAARLATAAATFRSANVSPTPCCRCRCIRT